jgi:hypothetical protein
LASTWLVKRADAESADRTRMLSTYLHHITLHFPIVGTMMLGALGAWTLREESQALRSFLRWAGWALFGLTSVATGAGLWAMWTGAHATLDMVELGHHRNMGLMVWSITALAAGGYERGIRADDEDWRRFGVAMWCVAGVAVIGAGHWGGAGMHPDVVPW